jgi:hypothetical protein
MRRVILLIACLSRWFRRNARLWTRAGRHFLILTTKKSARGQQIELSTSKILRTSGSGHALTEPGQLG